MHAAQNDKIHAWLSYIVPDQSKFMMLTVLFMNLFTGASKGTPVDAKCVTEILGGQK